MRILFLLADVFSYNFAVLDILNKTYNHEVNLIHWGKNSGSINHIKFYKPKYKIYVKPKKYKDLEDLTKNITPNIIIIAGWMDRNYLKIAYKYKKMGCKIVCAMDTKYDNNFKQILASTFYIFKIYKKLFFTKVWIPGYPQFETAIRFGFKRSEIIYGLLSADTNIFKNVTRLKKNKSFLFVGRLEKEKGVDLLIDTWKKITINNPEWVLVIVGNGKLNTQLKSLNNVVLKGFLNPEEVANEMHKVDCLILPSFYEPWGLVLHEATLCGLPIICTCNCGASSSFVIDNYNGFIVDEKIENSLLHAMNKIIKISDTDFSKFSKCSLLLGNQMSSNISAAHLNASI